MEQLTDPTVNYRFDDFELRPRLRQMLGGARPLALGARAFDLLLALVEHRDRVLGHEELLALCWPGLVVEENNLRQQVAALRRTLGPDVVATVPGRGYRFGRSVEAVEDFSSPAVATDVAGGLPAIAVLAFPVLSEDRALALVSNALVEDLTALLARVGGLTVISRGSSLSFQGRDTSSDDIGRQLGARYLVDGALREVGEGVRVTARLVEAAGARVLWSSSFECSRSGVLDLQDGIARSVLTEIEPQLHRAELLRIEHQRPDSVDAWGLYRRGLVQLGSEGLTPHSLRAALGYFDEATRADPSFGLAHAHHALLTSVGFNVGLLPDGVALRHATIARAETALELDPSNAEVLGFVGCAFVEAGLRALGMRSLRHAVVLDPSNAQALVALGAAHGVDGRYDEAIPLMRRGMAISPRDRRLGFWSWALADFLHLGGQREQALAEVRLARQRDPRLFLAPLLEAALLAEAGEHTEAAQALATARRLHPELDVVGMELVLGERRTGPLRPLLGDRV
jgi:TolB-like protein/Tfp pilus assembly protein PilF